MSSRTIIYGGEKNQRYQLVESDHLFVIRTLGQPPETIFRSIPSIANHLDQIELYDSFPEVSVYVYQCLPGNNNGLLRDDFKALVKQANHPSIAFIGSVLMFEQSGIYQLYTGNIFIKFYHTVPLRTIEALFASRHLEEKLTLGFASNAFLVNPVQPIGNDIFALSEELLSLPEVEYAHPELVVKRRAVMRQESSTEDHRLLHININSDWALEKVNATTAWQHTRGKGVRIAVIDDGLDFSHPAFARPGKAVAGRDMFDKWDRGFPVHQFNAEMHGTACASIACSEDPLALGVAPEAQLIPIRSLGLGSVMEAEAFYWAVRQGADIISCSWGPPDGNPFAPAATPVTYPIPDHTRLAISYAARRGRGGKGCLIFFAAGNGNEPVHYDLYASHPDVMAIGATNRDNQKTVYSDYGSPIFCCFPSGDYVIDESVENANKLYGLTVADRTGMSGYDSGDYYHAFDGTSASAPGAAGIAALLLSLAPHLTREEAKSVLAASCQPLGSPPQNEYSNIFGHGLLRADLVVRHALTLLQPTNTNNPFSLMPTPVQSPIQRLSLHIGINQTGPFYQGKIRELHGCISDMYTMRQLATNQGFLVKAALTDATATRRNILDAIEDLTRLAQPGDLVMITYAGHGTQILDESGDEQDGRDEAWVTYDGLLTDDELYAAYARFRQGARVIMVSDSCHSGTMNRDGSLALYADMTGTPRFVPMEQMQEILKHNGYSGSGGKRAAARTAADETACVARIKLLAACEDHQVAMETGGRGVFTTELETVFKSQLTPAVHYQSFLELIRQRMHPSQQPKLNDVGGQDPVFDNQQPFTDKMVVAGTATATVPPANPENPPTPMGVIGKYSNKSRSTSFVSQTEASQDRTAWDQAYRMFLNHPETFEFCEPAIASARLAQTPAPARSHKDQETDSEFLETYPYPQDTYPGEKFIWHLDEHHSQLRQALEAVFPEIHKGEIPEKHDMVTIAHIDTGYLRDHPLLPLNLDQKSSNEFDAFSDTGAIDAPDQMAEILEQDGHGNATLAILAGKYVTYGQTGHQYEGYFGAFPFARVISYRISDTVILNGGEYFAKAVEDAIRKKVDVITMSMAGIPGPAMADAVNQAYEAGIVIVSATGNSFDSNAPQSDVANYFKDKLLPETVLYPARYERVLAVTGATFQHTPYLVNKNKGWKSRWAGSALMQMSFGPRSAMKHALAGYTPNITWFGGKEKHDPSLFSKTGGGTSSATPQVAAAAALYIQKYKTELREYNDWRKVEIVRQALFASAHKDPSIDWQLYFGNGILRAYNAISDESLSPAVLAKSIRQAPRATCSFLAFREIFNLYAERNMPAGENKQEALREMLNTELVQHLYTHPQLQYLTQIEPDEVTNADLIRLIDEIHGSDQASDFLKRSIRVPKHIVRQHAAGARGDAFQQKYAEGKETALEIVSSEISSRITYISSLNQGAACTIEEYGIEITGTSRDGGENTLDFVVSNRPGWQSAVLITRWIDDRQVHEWSFEHKKTSHEKRGARGIYEGYTTPEMIHSVDLQFIDNQASRDFLGINPARIIARVVSWIKEHVIGEVEGEAVDGVAKGVVTGVAAIAGKTFEAFYYDLDRTEDPDGTAWGSMDSRLKDSKNKSILDSLKQESTTRPVLLVFPGFLSTVQKGMDDLLQDNKRVAELRKTHCRYIIGFNYPTLTEGIEDNAQHVVDFFAGSGLKNSCFNVIGRSRGGVVARYLFEQQSGNLPLKLNRMFLTGTPNQGSPLAKNDRWKTLVDLITNTLGYAFTITGPGFILIKELLAAIVDEITDLPGMNDLEPGSKFLEKTLNQQVTQQTTQRYFVVTSDYTPESFWAKIIDFANDGYFFRLQKNDFVVPVESALFQQQGQAGANALPSAQYHIAPKSRHVDHFDYLKPANGDLIDLCIAWLTACNAETPLPPSPTDPAPVSTPETIS